MCMGAGAITTVENAPSQHFVDICDKFFDDPTTYRALDKDGHDVTNDFYSRNKDLYSHKQYQLIQENFMVCLSAFT